MERDITIQILLNETFNNLIIKKVLRRALSLNIKMYKYVMAESYYESPIEIATILSQINNNEDEAPVLCKFEDTRFYLSFFESENGKCEFGVLLTQCPWKKEFENGKEMVEFDMPRYIRLMLQLASGLKLEKLKARIEAL